MTIIIIGASGSGKSCIEKELCKHHGFKKIISYTTRDPRPGEINGKDYYFITNGQFDEMLKLGLFAEYDEYSHGRKYGTLKSDYEDISDNNKVVVLTPNGLRQVKNVINKKDIYTVLVQASLGTRIKRYIDRIGANNFTYDDKNEIASRVERDYSMFLGAERESDFIVQNEDGTDIITITNEIVNSYKEDK